MEPHSENRNRIMNKSVRQYLHYVFYHPRLVCRIMASLNGVFFMALSTILFCNMSITLYYKQQSSSTSKPSNADETFGLDLQMPAELMYTNEDKVFNKSLFNLILTVIMFLVNIRLLMATYYRNLCSISTWLFVHTTHMLYSLSINLWVGVAKGYNSLIYLTLFNTLLYLLFISLVTLFWIEERCSMRIPMRANDKAETSQERMA